MFLLICQLQEKQLERIKLSVSIGHYWLVILGSVWEEIKQKN